MEEDRAHDGLQGLGITNTVYSSTAPQLLQVQLCRASSQAWRLKGEAPVERTGPRTCGTPYPSPDVLNLECTGQDAAVNVVCSTEQ